MVPCPNCGEENPERFRLCGFCGTPLHASAAPRREVRKTVTMLFSDVTGSTALGEQLDPESLRTVMGRYFAAMRQVIERHGGTVEKFIGDAIMAVFGIPVLHEDDALRAVRAAAEMRDALEHLNRELELERGVRIAVRTGVNTGEVVAGDPSAGQTLVTGDTVNTAARLEQAAGAGEILLGEGTARLVRDAVVVEHVPPLDAKGKALPVAAVRLVSVTGGAQAHSRRLDAPLVGRERELSALDNAFQRAISERACQLFTLLGPAGVGKSRLTGEFVASVSSDATVLRGRCLPYGEGITYWPVGEVVREAAGVDETDSGDQARGKLHALLEGERDGDTIGARVASAIGFSVEPAPQEELFWAVRRLLEALARRRPLVVVWDDIHWAEPTFLDLIEHIADWSRNAPLLLLCPARPELLDIRAGWGGGKLNATTILLEPLPPEAAARLIEHLPGGSALDAQTRRRITEAAEGNPLFVEEMLGMLVDDGYLRQTEEGWQAARDLASVRVPPSIQALLAARLDRLGADERAVAERAAVVGRVFERSAVAELAPDALRPRVTRHLLGLVRKELVRPDEPGLGGDDAFRFRHILIRDAAYDALPKAERAALHERFADWLERTTGERVIEYEDIVAHHLEQAYRYRQQLGQVDERGRALGRRAAVLLAHAGKRAVDRADFSAAAGLLRRALDLEALPTGERLRSREHLVHSLRHVGKSEDATAVARALISDAAAAGDRAAQVRAEVELFALRSHFDPSVYANAEELQGWIDELEAHADVRGLARAWRVYAEVEGFRMRWQDALDPAERAVAAAERTGDASLLTSVHATLGLSLIFSPLPVPQAVPRLELVLDASHAPAHRAVVLCPLACLLLLDGRTARAREMFSKGLATDLELGLTIGAAQDRLLFAIALITIGDFAYAAELLAAAEEDFRLVDDAYSGPTAAALAALVHARLARDEDLDRLLLAARGADATDMVAQAQWRWAAAAVEILRDGDRAQAERLAREAVALLRSTQDPLEQGEGLVVLAEVLAWDGRKEEAAAALQEALERFAAKQAKAAVARVQRLRETINAST